MSNKIISSIFVLVLFSFYGNAQVISKLSQNGFYARFTPNGENIVFSSSDFTGLKKMNIESTKTEILSSDIGAGYNPIVDNDKVLFSTRGNRGVVNQVEYKSKKVTTFNNTNLYSIQAKELSAGKKQSNLPIGAKSSNDLSSIEIIYADGSSKLVNTDKATNKIWVSLSPNKNMILYTVVGQETFITDLKGNVIASLERTETPRWANDNTIVYMLTKEKIDYITAGDIYKFNLEDKKSSLLTSKFDGIAMYPDMTVDGNKVVFNNAKGELFLIQLNN